MHIIPRACARNCACHQAGVESTGDPPCAKNPCCEDAGTVIDPVCAVEGGEATETLLDPTVVVPALGVADETLCDDCSPPSLVRVDEWEEHQRGHDEGTMSDPTSPPGDILVGPTEGRRPRTTIGETEPTCFGACHRGGTCVGSSCCFGCVPLPEVTT